MSELVSGIARSAMLVDLNIAVYSGRKQDKRTQEEVVTAKGSNSKRAASVYKSLFADCAELEAIVKFQARARAEHYRLTLPWNDHGARLLPTAAMFEYSATMNRYQEEFTRLVQVFLDKYDTLVAAAAFQLGTLFDRSEYPLREQVERRFRMESSYAPLPIAGDFRLDVERSVQEDLIAQYEERLSKQVGAATKDMWDRLHSVLTRLVDRLSPGEEGKTKKFHDTLVTSGVELCELLKCMNITNDPQLESARSKLESVLSGVTPKDLRESEGLRTDTKQRVAQILDAFDWGDQDE